MRLIRLAEADDFEAWRAVARALAQTRTPPREIAWTADGVGPATHVEIPPEAAGRVVPANRAFLELARAAFAHASGEKYGLLYRLLWRLGTEPGLMARAEDRDVARARALAEAARNRERAPAVASASFSATTPAVPQPRPSVSERVQKAALRSSRDGPFDSIAPTSLEEVAAGIDACRRCPLWRDTTQGVPGEGPARARMMLVGEQPGDQEDRQGAPFVGPAGVLLDKAMAVAGVDRGQVFVTNAVKHFKHELRGKRRLHKTPNAGEIEACRWWLDAERRLVRPKVIVALGASAALGVLGKATPIAANRGKSIAISEQVRGLVTYHPSYLLRIPDEDARHKGFEALVQDLKLASRLAAG
ncbi:MAG TPA: UdgX family uracil-DNA binding protein [Caulobacteraceae bacterium]|nr:UdgX family uracil-DNA binding protein [Caulobacteraceae bacterium]